ncbi:Flagellar hook-associated protein 1 [compost metagenome]
MGQVGAIAQRAMKAQESQKNVISQLTNIRESISGVSLDEETTKMIEFQKTYDASARLIKTADEMFDTILNLKRL